MLEFVEQSRERATSDSPAWIALIQTLFSANEFLYVD